MGNSAKRDLGRQAATVVGALFQVLAPAIVPIGVIAKETPSLVIPADYAFAIWGPIFVLCLAYATYQALPANGQNPLLQRVGWFLAGAFFLNGLWEVLVPLRQPVVLQAILAGIFACLVVGYVRLVRSDRSVWNRSNRWLVALHGLLAYAGAVLWALIGVVVNQYDASLLTTGAALLSGALVVIAAINTLGGRGPHIGASRSVRPRVAG